MPDRTTTSPWSPTRAATRCRPSRTTVRVWVPPHERRLVVGPLNPSVNCLARHVRGPPRDKPALVWEGDPGDRRTLTYFHLHRDGPAFANVLKSLGVRKGHRVAIYL